VLICTNLLDEPAKVMAFIDEISASYKIVLRLHPRDQRKEWSETTCTISTNPSIWDDLNESHIVITNESAVVLEAVYVDRLIYKAAFFSSSLDNYSFLKKGLLLREYSDIPSIIGAIEMKSIDYDKSKLKYFIGDVEGGKEKIADFFNSIS
jgi:CDP-glycerol glycerophosphotransferase (TagB/SpsB family)